MIVGKIYRYADPKPARHRHWRRRKLVRLYDDSGLWVIGLMLALVIGYGLAGSMDYQDALADAQIGAYGGQ